MMDQQKDTPVPCTSDGGVAESQPKVEVVSASLQVPSTSCSQANSTDAANESIDNMNLNESTTSQTDDDNEDDDEIVTMLDVLKDEEEQINDINAVLGGADDKSCTYQQGYVQRQPLYACKTCEMKVDPETGEKYLAGFCLGCSYHCHENHELVELYSKRNFRCDCGNEKYVDTTCKLYEKTGFNEDNQYNHNFSGVYCTCDRPYPDPEDKIDDVMIQCGLCEDWFHGRHLGQKDKFADTGYTELICFLCVKKYSFLVYYNEDGCFVEDTLAANDSIDGGNQQEIIAENETESVDSGIVASTSVGSQNDSSSNEPFVMPCKLAQLKQNYIVKFHSEDIDEAKFASMAMGRNWRSSLCKCTECKQMYSQLGISFITSFSDMVYAYEQKNKSKVNEGPSVLDKGMSELKKLHHVQQIEIIRGYNDFKNELLNYLKPFGEGKRVVRPEDIQEFVEQMQHRKRQRTNSFM